MKYFIVLAVSVFSLIGFCEEEQDQAQAPAAIAGVAPINYSICRQPNPPLIMPTTKEIYELANGAGCAPDCGSRQLLSNGTCGDSPYSPSANDPVINSHDLNCRGLEMELSRPERQGIVGGLMDNVQGRLETTARANREAANRNIVEIDGQSIDITDHVNIQNCSNLERFRGQRLVVSKPWWDRLHYSVGRVGDTPRLPFGARNPPHPAGVRITLQF